MNKLIIHRHFKSPVAVVWNHFTTKQLLKQWWAPASMHCSFISIDLKKGGLFRFCFQTADGKDYWGSGLYQTINAPNEFSYLDTFTDPEGKPVPPSYYDMAGNEVVEALVEVQLIGEAHSTDMTITMENYYSDNMTKEMKQGWNEIFDKLELML